MNTMPKGFYTAVRHDTENLINALREQGAEISTKTAVDNFRARSYYRRCSIKRARTQRRKEAARPYIATACLMLTFGCAGGLTHGTLGLAGGIAGMVIGLGAFALIAKKAGWLV